MSERVIERVVERWDPLLAFDCSGASCSAAVLVDGTIRADRFQAMERGQAEALLPMIEAAMAEAGLDWPDLTAIATTVGPGSFTGVRLGLSAARGLALAAGKPVVALTAFEAVVAGLTPDALSPGGRPVAVAIDSRRGPVFAQRFTPALQPAGEPAQLEPDEVADWLGPGPWRITGDGVANLAEIRFAADIAVDATPRRIRAGDLARAAAALGPAGIDRLPAHPLYLRAPDVTQPKPRP
ncbi:tRNA (adenosine(37)-N6)-threonylcarbamoyltransferase complex dimerization subunit type 1 TsaB [Aliidongia dinghuensis]|uniref:tRNA (Adenosine(37)-N6)-threonylcarbamoyltransferase complex dimerization subunit type 1 TsaB n=1 Tax=Aliidongia dinghuensis TaxID=1867774 RepID=A0A8J2YPH4_9PROT|nr:tRNA (adenosine(37)-N6)-threonylcarbamoyltransferase complex dimerization subunit type 1 TsaB [Aliidongia dinghuensis]GGE99741.1 tRNA (adenosine(37)-N6)-threonylcarbamoyltransferase complex dimerization subunit type 1 TsaB [Aliidongia dinghuensis]